MWPLASESSLVPPITSGDVSSQGFWHTTIALQLFYETGQVSYNIGIIACRFLLGDHGVLDPASDQGAGSGLQSLRLSAFS